MCVWRATDEGDQPEHARLVRTPVRLRAKTAMPDIEAKIVDGELWLCRGPNLMEGYYGRERHETFTPDQWYSFRRSVPRRR